MHKKVESANWQSFWDVASPYEAASAFIELYGSNAVSAAQECVRTAVSDGRNEDARFWKAVIVVLRNNQQQY